MKIPTYDSMMNPLIKSLRALGGSGTIDELNEKVIEILDLPDDIVNIPHDDKGSRTEIEYRLAWTRTYLKKFGVLENSTRGIWALTEGKDGELKVNPQAVIRHVRENDSKKPVKPNNGNKAGRKVGENDEEDWKEELINLLLKIDPSQFERLAQRILRESGFTQVEVTGKSGDGGIDGKGIIKIGGLLSFHAMFQCKRYEKSVSPSHIRDFRGALQGRADKGLFITTGTFTREAIKEAQRDGAPPIDLIDGNDLAEKLKELLLGIEIKLIEQVVIKKEWFEKI